jgi:hypothetical protein
MLVILLKINTEELITEAFLHLVLMMVVLWVVMVPFSLMIADSCHIKVIQIVLTTIDLLCKSPRETVEMLTIVGITQITLPPVMLHHEWKVLTLLIRHLRATPVHTTSSEDTMSTVLEGLPVTTALVDSTPLTLVPHLRTFLPRLTTDIHQMLENSRKAGGRILLLIPPTLKGGSSPQRDPQLTTTRNTTLAMLTLADRSLLPLIEVLRVVKLIMNPNP